MNELQEVPIDPLLYQQTLQRLRLKSVWLDESHSFADRDAWENGEVTIQLDSSAFARQTPTEYRAYIHYVLTGEQAHNAVLKLDATYCVIFDTTVPVPHGFFDIFQEINLKMTTMPYFRELVASFTGRMGLPPVTLPYSLAVPEDTEDPKIAIGVNDSQQTMLGIETRSSAMSLTALTEAGEVAAAFEAMRGRLQQDAQPFDRYIGWPGGGDDFRIYWHEATQFWSLAEAFGGHHPGYWFGFGATSPQERPQMSPDVQLGMPGSGSNRRYAGVFARDEDGRVYATHTGRFQVRYQRTDPDGYLEEHPDQNVAVVRWPDGFERVHLVVVAVDDPLLVDAVAEFVHGVEEYKENLRSGQ